VLQADIIAELKAVSRSLDKIPDVEQVRCL
jgi:hypothetical protein